VLAALAVHPGEVMSSDRLADALWGEEPPASWSKVVHGCVMRLRKALGPAAIETTSGGYRLSVTGDDLDTLRFEAMVERGRELASSGAPERAASTLASALSLWRGAPFEDVDGWAPGRGEAVRLEELRRSAEEDLLDARLASGEHREVAAEGEARVGEEPLRERRWATLALAQYRCGRQADALRSLQGARRILVDQLGIDPGPELVELEAAILRQDPDLSGRRSRCTARTRGWSPMTSRTKTASSAATPISPPAWNGSPQAPYSWSRDRRVVESRRSYGPDWFRRCSGGVNVWSRSCPGGIPTRR
jgi:DNA-binding SARP family transcriptional activator